MSDDFINQLTLNFLISRNNLQKLNNQYKTENKTKKFSIHKKRLIKLFNDLLVSNPPNDLLCDVTSSFEAFVDKSIYYFKVHDETIRLEKERSNTDIHDDIDFDSEERAIEKGNYKENNYDEEVDEDEEEEADEEVDEEADEDEEEADEEADE